MIERVIKERGQYTFLARNADISDGLFNIYKGALYRLYDEHDELWMTVAVRRQPSHGIVSTDVASGLMIINGTSAKSYDDVIRDIVRQKESIDKARDTDYYKVAVKLCQAEYAELRERGVEDLTPGTEEVI